MDVTMCTPRPTKEAYCAAEKAFPNASIHSLCVYANEKDPSVIEPQRRCPRTGENNCRCNVPYDCRASRVEDPDGRNERY